MVDENRCFICGKRLMTYEKNNTDGIYNYCNSCWNIHKDVLKGFKISDLLGDE